MEHKCNPQTAWLGFKTVVKSPNTHKECLLISKGLLLVGSIVLASFGLVFFVGLFTQETQNMWHGMNIPFIIVIILTMFIWAAMITLHTLSSLCRIGHNAAQNPPS